MAYCSSHAPDLPVHPLIEGELNPYSGNVLAESDRNGTLRDLGISREYAHLRRPHPGSRKQDTAPEPMQCLFIGHSLDLREVDFRQLMLRISDSMGQGALRGEDHQPFTVQIKAPSGIDPWNPDEISKGRPAFWIGKARQDSIRFIEFNGGHLLKRLSSRENHYNQPL